MADRLFVQQVDAQLRFEQSWAEIQGYLLAVLDVAGRRPGRGRGADGHPGRRGGAGAARAAAARAARGTGTSSSSTARRPPRRCGCWRCPRRSAGTCSGSSRSSAGSSRRSSRCCPGRPACRCPRTRSSTRSSGCTASSTRSAALLTGPDATRPAGADARDGRPRRGTPVLHDAVALRLPRRRRRGQPGVPGRRAPTTGGPGWVLAQDEVLDQVAAVLRRAAGLALGLPPGRAGRRRRAAPPRRRSCTAATTRSRCPPVPGPFRISRDPRGRRAAAGAAAGRPRRGRPRAERRRAGRDRGVVSSAAHAARRRWPATGSPAARVEQGELQVRFEESAT